MPTWVRCRDKDTGHEYDLAANDRRVLDGVVEVLKDYPSHTGATPRPAKHRTTKSGRPQRKQAEQSAENTEE